jgi:hypothetical protein
MNLRFDGICSWVSPVCLGAVAFMLYAAGGTSQAGQGWSQAAYWAICGALTATGVIFSLFSLMAAKQHLRVARARMAQLSRVNGTPRTRRGSFQS